MSEENVEVVRAQIDAYNRGDYDAALALLDEEVEWHVPEVAALDAPASGIVQGRARVAEQFARWLEAWETHAFQVTDALSRGDDVFIAGLQVGRGRHSGLYIRVPTFHVFTVRDQKIVAMRAFPERAEALEAAGLSEWGRFTEPG
jgi:ketosteroid isomerase-like protein